MKKLLCLFLVIGLLIGCSSKSEKEDNKDSLKDEQLDNKEENTSKDDFLDNEIENVDESSLVKTQLTLTQSVQENNYYCVPACLQMVLRYKGIEKSQSELAKELNTKQTTGTEYVDLARVANKYLFNNENVKANEPGYHVQTITRYDENTQIVDDFERRVKTDISTNDPIFVAIDMNVLYPELSSANHLIVITGYAHYEDSEEIAYYYYIDPLYTVQDKVYGGLKIATREEMIKAIIVNVEPAYIY